MKNILTLFTLLATITAFGQTKSCDTTRNKINGYLSYGLSLTNSNSFKKTSYTGLEGGITYGQIGLGGIFGRGSLMGLASKSDNISNYFYEVKTFASQPMGKLTSTVLFG